MDLKIIEQKENPLFKRKEVLAEMNFDSAPSKENARNLVSEKFSASPEKTEIKKISGKFGSHRFFIRAFIYESEEEKNILEKKPHKKVKAQ